MNIEPKVWNSNTKGTQIHVFLNGTAKCGSGDKQGRSPMHTRSDGQVFAEDTRGLVFCKTCEKNFIAAEKKMAAKRARMIAKTGVPFTPQDNSWRKSENVSAASNIRRSVGLKY